MKIISFGLLNLVLFVAAWSLSAKVAEDVFNGSLLAWIICYALVLATTILVKKKVLSIGNIHFPYYGLLLYDALIPLIVIGSRIFPDM
jgi:hypothetical protein